MVHPSQEVEHALIRLNDALCTWERCTGRRSILILRETGGYVHRSQDGKPLPPSVDDVTDQHLLAGLQ